MLNRLFSLASRCLSQKKKKLESAPKRRTRLTVEPLESREVPAGGVVTASVVKGSLYLVGDGNTAGNNVRLLEQAPGEYDVQGQAGTLVKLGATGTPTTVFRVTGVSLDIKGTFGGGNDTFDYTGLFGTKLRDMILNMGPGNDTVATSFFDIRNLTITQGVGDTGNDSINISQNLGMNGGIRGSVSITNGGGSDTTTLAVKVAGNVKIANTSGGDTIKIQNTSYIGGSVTITNTTGTTGNDTRIQGGSYISKGLSITNGNFENINQVLSSFVGGSVSITNGDSFGGTTQNIIDTSTIGGSVTTKGTHGQDRTNILSSTVGRSVSITGGNGTASNDLVNSTIGGSYVATNGAGSAAQTITNSTILGNLQLTFGSTAGSSNYYSFTTVSVFGSTTIIGGANQDQLNIDKSRFVGNASFSLGAGADTVTIGAASGTPLNFFHGNLSIAVGAGIDKIDLKSNKVRVSGVTTFSGDNTDTLITNEGPFSNIYLLGIKKVGIV